MRFHTVDWKLIYQQKQTQINCKNILGNRNRVDHDYKDVDKFMISNHAAYKYEIPYKGPFFITRCFTNVTVNIQYGPTKISHNIRRIDPHKSDTNIKDINPENMCKNFNI